MHKKKSPQIFTLIPQIFTLIHKVFYKAGMDKIKKESSFHLTPFIQLCRGNKIRTCDHTPPRRVLYRAELYPELRLQKYGIYGKLANFLASFLE